MTIGLPLFDRAPWNNIADALREKEHFVLCTHQNPDGDGLGAQLGLWEYLKNQGKSVSIINPDPLPTRYEFLNTEKQFQGYDQGLHDKVLDAAEVAIFLDFSRWDRMGAPLEAKMRDIGALTVCVDHHPVEDGPANLNGLDETAAATGQLAYELIRSMGGQLTPVMATGFYTSILTDTGSFRFSNSDSRAHRVTAELLETGIDPSVLYEKVYGEWELSRLRLMSLSLANMESLDEERVLLLPVTRQMIDDVGAHETDAEGFVDVARSVRTCECVVLLVEREGNQTKLSFRSKGRVNVQVIAESLGGGGHLYAAGATVSGNVQDARELVYHALKEGRFVSETS